MLSSRLATGVGFSRKQTIFVEMLEIRVFSNHSLLKKKKILEWWSLLCPLSQNLCYFTEINRWAWKFPITGNYFCCLCYWNMTAVNVYIQTTRILSH